MNQFGLVQDHLFWLDQILILQTMDRGTFHF